jgi:hypothetical protein
MILRNGQLKLIFSGVKNRNISAFGSYCFGHSFYHIISGTSIYKNVSVKHHVINQRRRVGTPALDKYENECVTATRENV